eukprot:scaffold1690_cov177-Ochromonas_danica.AAC.13
MATQDDGLPDLIISDDDEDGQEEKQGKGKEEEKTFSGRHDDNKDDRNTNDVSQEWFEKEIVSRPLTTTKSDNRPSSEHVPVIECVSSSPVICLSSTVEETLIDTTPKLTLLPSRPSRPSSSPILSPSLLPSSHLHPTECATGSSPPIDLTIPTQVDGKTGDSPSSEETLSPFGILDHVPIRTTATSKAESREQAEGSKFQEDTATVEKSTNSAIKKSKVEEQSKEEAKILDLGELQSRAAEVMKAMNALITSTSLSPADLSREIDGHMKALQVIKELIAQASVSEAKVTALPMQDSYESKPLRETKTIVDGDNGWYEDDLSHTQFSLDRPRKIDYEEEETVQSEDENPSNLSQEPFGTQGCAAVLASLHGKNMAATSSAQKPTTGSVGTPGRLFNTMQVMAGSSRVNMLEMLPASKNDDEQKTKHQVRRRKFASPQKQQTSLSGSAVVQKKQDDDFAFPSTEKSISEEGSVDDKEEEDEEDLRDSSSDDEKPAPKAKSNRQKVKLMKARETPGKTLPLKKARFSSSSSSSPLPAPSPPSRSFPSLEISKSSVQSSSTARIPSGSASDVLKELESLDLPEYFLEGVPTVWALLWKDLESVGWFWMRGRGLVDFYYLRPHAKPTKPFILGTDYFTSESDVEKFVRDSVRKVESTTSKVREEPVQSSVLSKQKQAVETVDEEVSVGSNDGGALKKSVEPIFLTFVNDSQSLSVASYDSQSSPQERGAVNGLDANKQQRHDLRAIAWKDLWKMLRSMGWTWEFGPGHLNYYYAPGHSYKTDKKAILGRDKFINDEEVKRFLRKEIKSGRGEKWPQLYVSEKLQSQDSIMMETQEALNHLYDPQWMLTTHRRKRDSLSTGQQDQMEEGGEKAENEQQSIAKSSAKKARIPNSGNGGLPSRAESFQDVSEDLTQAHLTASPVTKMHRANRPSTVDIHTRPLLTSPVSPEKFSKPSPSIHSSSARKENSISEVSSELFLGWNFLISGLTDSLRSELEKTVKKYGGTLHAHIPKDYDTRREDEQWMLISQPQDFRKPKYIQAVVEGLSLVHYCWIQHSVEQRKLLSITQYALPAAYSALHSHYIFSPKQNRTPKILNKLRVVNLTGQKIWNDLLLTAGAVVVPNNENTLKSLRGLSFKQCIASGQQSFSANPYVADCLLFDPAIYLRTITLHQQASPVESIEDMFGMGSGKKVRPNTDHTHGGDTSPKATISWTEVEVLYHCRRLYDEVSKEAKTYRLSYLPPIVASVEWLNHCLALNTFVNIRSLNIFSLPNPSDLSHPTSYKADLEVVKGGSGGGSPSSSNAQQTASSASSVSSAMMPVSGERYCTHDFVCFAHGTGAFERDRQSLGKILGFIRRSSSHLLVRLRTLEVQKKRNRDGQKVQILHAPADGMECMVPVRQLVKKIVVFHAASYEEVQAYALTDGDIYTCSTEDWSREWPQPNYLGEEEAQAAIRSGVRGSSSSSSRFPAASQDF